MQFILSHYILAFCTDRCTIYVRPSVYSVLEKRHDRERLALLAEELGADTVRRDPVRAHFIHPEQEAQTARAQATAAHREAEELRTLTPREAATLIETKRAAEQFSR